MSGSFPGGPGIGTGEERGADREGAANRGGTGASAPDPTERQAKEHT